MRVAMLSSTAWRSASKHHGLREHVVSILAEGLATRGVEVALFATNDPQTNGEPAGIRQRRYEGNPAISSQVEESLHISGVFERGDEFDLIHNHLHYPPLTYVKMTTTPLVSTLYDILTPEVLPVYRKYNGRAYYVAVSDAHRHPELDFIATIHHGIDEAGFSVARMVEDYLHVYNWILAQRRREDHRPWGYYRVLEDEPDHKVKRLVVYPGKRLSLQRHKHRTEHWLILQGHALITLNDETISMEAGQAMDVPQGAWHRIRNPGAQNMAVIEVQTGNYFGEDDIERAEDDYGRV